MSVPSLKRADWSIHKSVGYIFRTQNMKHVNNQGRRMSLSWCHKAETTSWAIKVQSYTALISSISRRITIKHALNLNTGRAVMSMYTRRTLQSQVTHLRGRYAERIIDHGRLSYRENFFSKENMYSTVVIKFHPTSSTSLAAHFLHGVKFNH